MKQTPSNLTVEKHLLSQAMLFPDLLAMVVERLTEDAFFATRHAAIFGALGDLHQRGLDVGLEGLEHSLTASGRLEAAGGPGYLHDVACEAVSGAGIDHNIQILLDLSARRKLIRALGDSLDAAYDLAKPILEVQDKAEAEIMAVGDSRSTGPQLKPMRQVLSEASKEWQDVANGKPGGLMSRVKAMDDLLLGFRPGKLYILAARPGLGKSMLALQFMAQCGQTVAGYSMEMKAGEQAERLISQECDLNSDSLRSQVVLLAKGKMLAGAITKLADLPIWFCDEPPITPAQILAQGRRLKKSHGLGLIVVDYLQLLKGGGKYERRDLEVGAISKALKQISMKLSVPVLTIASLSRKPEERTDKRPLLSDLRESGDIESDADAVLFLYRESDYNPQAKKQFPNVTELIVAKNRGGKKGRAVLDFDGAHSKFYDLHPDAAAEYLRFLEGKSNDKATQPGNPNQVSGHYSDSFFPR